MDRYNQQQGREDDDQDELDSLVSHDNDMVLDADQPKTKSAKQAMLVRGLGSHVNLNEVACRAGRADLRSSSFSEKQHALESLISTFCIFSVRK
mmetsp:Transcript_26486/g.103183  ORF Transcript_26486/g.103183 Transcript_26486/m.103183 type:complete len:94 (-) Transcript_26486:2683-2964(-)